MKEYLIASKYIDCDNDMIRSKAAELSNGIDDDSVIAKACFNFVRDEILHSWDYKKNPVTCKASDALKHHTGYCYAKSHLLAALLRANEIPAGLCYQRLSVGDSGAPYCLHGLNAVYLKNYGWYRCDARGNKPGVDAQFTPPNEVLSFPVNEFEECDLPEIWSTPLQVVVDVLENYSDVAEVYANLPDIELWANNRMHRTRDSTGNA